MFCLTGCPWRLPRALLVLRRGAATASAASAAAKREPLQRAVRAERATEGITQWVVFSDLHVRRSSVSTCLEVLAKVHEEAARRGAGVLFLGDFWHERGNIPVQPLSEIMAAFNSWRQPMLMLVGNHDQVTLGGTVHALAPFALSSNERFFVFDEPTLFRDSLWLPYRKEHDKLFEAVQSAPGPLNAIFGHLDIVGATFNESCQAIDGMDPAAFSPKIPVYTGHYHLPHTVPRTNITYVGSPYQVSFSEAGCDKTLFVLDENWAVRETIPIDIGPRHFSIQGDGQNHPDSIQASVPKTLRAEDHVKVLLPNHEIPKALKTEVRGGWWWGW
jgi:DNA repair exonuclease SbcCD nuclease subunit